MTRREVGARFLAELRKSVPVEAGFWVKPVGGDWLLYVAFDRPLDDVHDAYREVGRVADELRDPDFDSSEVRLIGSDDRLAKEVREFRRRRPGRTLLELSGWTFGGDVPDEAYLYPDPPAPPAEPPPPAPDRATSSSRARRRPA
jgi:hypothetical protein